MSAKDFFHNTVKKALIKDGWEITHDPYRIEIGEIEYRIDLAAEQLIAAHKADFKIAVEVKSFLGQSKTYELHTAIGQFNNYFVALEEIDPKRQLYLAISDYIYENLFKHSIVQKTIARYQIKLIVVDIKDQKIEKWIK